MKLYAWLKTWNITCLESVNYAIEIRVIFDKSKCVIEKACDGKVLFIGKRSINVYTINIDCVLPHDKYFSAWHDDRWLWHRRLGHVGIDLISKFSKNDLVKGLPNIGFKKDRICEACQFGKQIKKFFKNKNHVSTSKLLQFIHMDLFGSSRYASLSDKYYAFVIVNEHLSDKYYTFQILDILGYYS